MKAESINPELVLAIAGLLGSDSLSVRECLKSELEKYGYDVEIIKVSSIADQILSERYEELQGPKDEKEDGRIGRLMALGNRFREDLKTGAAMILPVIARMRRSRSAAPSDLKRAIIIDSLKHPEEVAVLRKIFGQRFLLLSIFAPRDQRISALSQRLRHSNRSFNADDFTQLATDLVNRDQKEDRRRFGQNMADCFPLADFFVDQSIDENPEREIKRFLMLLFGYPYQTPTEIEMAMFQANAAALRSSDLARQVGAVTIDKMGSLLTSGCNEVPQAGGGLLLAGPRHDSEGQSRPLEGI